MSSRCSVNILRRRRDPHELWEDREINIDSPLAQLNPAIPSRLPTPTPPLHLLQLHPHLPPNLLLHVKRPLLHNPRRQIPATTLRIQTIPPLRRALAPPRSNIRLYMRPRAPMPVRVPDHAVGCAGREEGLGAHELAAQVVERCHGGLEEGADAEPADLHALPGGEAGLVGGVVEGGGGVGEREGGELEGHGDDGAVVCQFALHTVVVANG